MILLVGVVGWRLYQASVRSGLGSYLRCKARPKQEVPIQSLPAVLNSFHSQSQAHYHCSVPSPGPCWSWTQLYFSKMFLFWFGFKDSALVVGFLQVYFMYTLRWSQRLSNSVHNFCLFFWDKIEKVTTWTWLNVLQAIWRRFIQMCALLP